MTQWQKVKIGELFEQYRIEHLVQNSKKYGQITISKKGYVKFRTTKIGKLIGRKRQFIIDLKQHPNTLLFTRQGVADGAIGFAPKEVDACIATENMPMFELKNNVSKGFISFYLHSDYFKETIAKLKPTGSAQKSIHERDLMELELLIPSFDEQNVIANKIENQLHIVNDTSTEITHQQSLLKKLRQAILQEAIEGKLTKELRIDNGELTIETGAELLEKIKAEKEKLIAEKKIKKQKPLPPIEKDEIPFDIPGNWVWCRLGEILSNENHSMKRGPFGSSLTKDMFVKNGIKVYEQQNAIHDVDRERYYITKEKYEEMKAFTVKPFDLIISCSGATLGRISELNTNSKVGIINQALLKINLNKALISNSYFIKVFRSSFFQSIILKQAWGSAIPNMVGVKELKKMLIALPPFSEQKAIVKKIEHLFAMCDELETQINDSKANANMLMQAVLKEAFGN